MLSIRDNFVAFIWYWSANIRREKYSIVFFPLFIFHYLLGILTANDLSINVRLLKKPKIHHAIGIVVGSGVTFKGHVTLRAHVCIGEKVVGEGSNIVFDDGIEFGVGAMVFGSGNVKGPAVIKANSVLTL